jgi:hypothetical protein
MAPSSLFDVNAIDATSGMPALMNGSASRRECSWTTSDTSPRSEAYAVLNGQFPAPWKW